MSTTITDDTMTSTNSPHTARRVDGGWTVSWLPDRILDRNQALTAMTIAELVATNHVTPGSRYWLHLRAWAAELGLTESEAIVRTSLAPDGDK